MDPEDKNEPKDKLENNGQEYIDQEENDLGADDTEYKFPPLERKKRKGLSPLAVILIALLFLLCGWLGYWGAKIFLDPLVPTDKVSDIEPVYSSPDILNILLLGVDQRGNEPSRSDVIILACLDLKDKQVTLLSIPRDTRVEIPGKSLPQKINASHTLGGAELTVKTVEKFLQVPVHYYIETNFVGFEHCIDILGGVTLNVDQKMYLPEENIDLKQGLQKLNGHNALAYVRWRSDGKGDIGRIERQQKFFKALNEQAMRLSTIWKIPDLLGEINQQVKTDMSLTKMIAVANKFRDVKNVKLETKMVPGIPNEIDYSASYWIPDTKALPAILENIYGYTAKKQEVSAK